MDHKRKTLNGLWIGKTGESNAWYHIYPFVNSLKTRKLFVVRHKKPQRNINSSKVDFLTFNSKSFVQQLVKMFFLGFRVLQKNKISYVVSFSLVPWGVVAWVLAKLFNKKIIIGLIGTDYNQYVMKGRLSFLFKQILKNTDIIATTGSVMRKSVRANIRENNVFIFPHCLHDELILDKMPKKTNNLKIISISNFSKNKRVLDIVKAVQLLLNKGYAIKLDIIGRGKQFKNIEIYIKENNLQQQINLVGYVEKIKPFLQKGDIFVQASINEGLSLALIESIGMGLIPVVTEAGSEKDIIKNGYNGLFFEKKNYKDLANKIEILTNKKEYQRFFDLNKKNKKKLNIEHATNQVDKILNNI